MGFTKKILEEHAIKYFITFVIAAILLNPIRKGLISTSQSGKLEAIAVIMGIVTLCSLTGYFAFSYTTVGKIPIQRFFGYLCTFFLGLSLLLSLMIIYFIAIIWVPEMQMVWLAVLLSLYIGTVVFDNLDLLRMGMDVAATSFFEKDNSNKDRFTMALQFLKEGQRLQYANSLIGQAMIELGKEKRNHPILEEGEGIIKNSDQEQHIIDQRVARTFEKYPNQKIKSMVQELKEGQNQNVADSLIANLLELARETL